MTRQHRRTPTRFRFIERRVLSRELRPDLNAEEGLESLCKFHLQNVYPVRGWLVEL